MMIWERALGVQAVVKDNEFQILLEETRIVFIQDEDGRGEGIQSFEINVKDKDRILNKAKDKNLIKEGEVFIGGTKFLLN